MMDFLFLVALLGLGAGFFVSHLRDEGLLLRPR